MGDHFILLEDLESSSTWRLAQDEDMCRSDTGTAVADGYRHLHQAGKFYFQQAGAWPDWVKSWIGELDVNSLTDAGRKLGLDDVATWQTALHHLDSSKNLYRSFP